MEKLNTEDVLPAIPARPTHPVVAQLARPVAFETVTYPSSPLETSTNLPAKEAAAEAQELPDELNSNVSARSKNPAGLSRQEPLSSTSKTTREESASQDLTDAEPHKPSQTPAERIDQEHDTTLATTFATWPVLASVVASYLLAERHSRDREASVQTPPRRQRGVRAGLGNPSGGESNPLWKIDPEKLHKPMNLRKVIKRLATGVLW